MITVVIPTLNEEDTIGNVVAYARSRKQVNEVIVVDDKSLDATVKQAREAGARVITSSRLGKGASLKEGTLAASNEIVLFLDGDIDPYPHYTIDLLAKPLLNGEADFVKAAFSRNAGRVTELVAKPLLSIFFPDLLRFSQPLSGMIAGRRNLLAELEFSDDYGVDIGILIDMYLRNVRLKEVEIGYLENKSKPWQALGKMSREVARTIILKAADTRNPNFNVEELGVLQEIRSQMEFALEDRLSQLEKLIVFDMDNTLLRGRFIDRCAETFGFRDELMNIRSAAGDPVTLTKKIALLLKGISLNELMEVADAIPIVDGAAAVVGRLKERGYIVGIISDSYDCVTTHVRNKLGMDFSLSNELEFSKSVCTGEVKLPSFFFGQPNSRCRHTLCKTNAFLSLLDKYGIKKENTIAIGDGPNDLCMIKEAGIGIAFCSKDELLNHHADLVISRPTFEPLLELAG